MKNHYLSVIIPCFNEERNIRLGALESVAHFLGKKKYGYEVLIVDDGSKDDSVHLLIEFIKDHPQFHLIKNTHQGKAVAVTTGALKAVGDVVLFTDLDQATPIHQLDSLLPFFQKGYDVVIGSRSGKRKGAPVFRLLMAKGFMLIRNVILNLGIEDTQCGFKAFTQKAVKDIFPRLKIYTAKREISGSTVTAGFDVELLYIAQISGYKIKEVPVEWHYQETRHISPVKDSLDGLIDLVKIRINCIKGIYNNA